MEREDQVDLEDSISSKENKEDDDDDNERSTWESPNTEFKIDERLSRAIEGKDLSGSQSPMASPQLEPKKKEVEEGRVARKYAEEDPSHPNWVKHHKHVFILSHAGRPIYSRYGDELNLVTFMASLTAMVAYVQSMDDNLRYVVAGKHKFVFLVKGPIILVSVSKTREPLSLLIQQLNYMHAQVISVLTAGVNQILTRRAQYDLRNLLGGTDKFLDNLMSIMDHDASFMLNAIHCLRLDYSTRNAISNAMVAAQNSDLLYAILIAKYQLVNLIRPKKYILQAPDILLLMNFVNGSSAFRATESWTPVCLPKFNDSGYLHAYICFIAPDVCLVMLSTKQDGFFTLSNCKSLMLEALPKGCLDSVQKALQNQFFSVSELGIPSLLHFLYKSKGVHQFTCPRLETPYSNKHEQKRLFRLYQRAHKRVHRFKKPHKVYYQVSELETIIGWVTSGFELYAAFGVLESKATCIKGCNEILRWIKNEETSLFITNAPVW